MGVWVMFLGVGARKCTQLDINVEQDPCVDKMNQQQILQSWKSWNANYDYDYDYINTY